MRSSFVVIALTLTLASTVACTKPHVLAVYDPDTHLLTRLDYAADNGPVTTHTYFSGGRPVRLEADANGDGLVDRWEYYDAKGTLLRLGTSSRTDGIEDTWVTQTGDASRVDRSTQRDALTDRHEFYQRDALVRVERDTNFDGLLDQWQQFDNGSLKVLSIDTTQHAGRPDRRLVYGNGGTVERIEVDPDGSGHFKVEQTSDGGGGSH